MKGQNHLQTLSGAWACRSQFSRFQHHLQVQKQDRRQGPYERIFEETPRELEEKGIVIKAGPPVNRAFYQPRRRRGEEEGYFQGSGRGQEALFDHEIEIGIYSCLLLGAFLETGPSFSSLYALQFPTNMFVFLCLIASLQEQSIFSKKISKN